MIAENSSGHSLFISRNPSIHLLCPPASLSPSPLAQYDPADREGLGRVNDAVDPLDGEQTWPSEQELLDVEKLVKGRERKRRLPAGVGCEV